MTTGTMEQRIAEMAGMFQRRHTGLAPRAVSVAQGGGTLVVTLDGALSPAELALSRTPAGAAEVRDYHRGLFASGLAGLRRDVEQITGVAVRDAASEVDHHKGAIIAPFTNGTLVHVYLLAAGISPEAWGAISKGDDAENGSRSQGVNPCSAPF